MSKNFFLFLRLLEEQVGSYTVAVDKVGGGKQPRERRVTRGSV